VFEVRNRKSTVLYLLMLIIQILTACTNVNADDIDKPTLEEDNTKISVLDKNGAPITGDYIVRLYNDIKDNKQETSSEIKTTIDLNLQQEVAKEIDKIPNMVKYSFVIMNPYNGEIIAISENSEDTYIPSSTFKGISSAIFLDTHIIEKDTIVDSSPYSIGNTTVRSLLPLNKEEISFEEALIKKCNPVFARLASETGKENFFSYLNEFGIKIPDNKSDFTDEELALYSIGQVEVTPMEMALAYSVLANGGNSVQPELILQLDSSELDKSEKSVISAKTSEQMKELLHKCNAQNKNSNSDIAGIYGISSDQDSNIISCNFAGISSLESNSQFCLVVSISTSEASQSITEQLSTAVNNIMDIIINNNI